MKNKKLRKRIEKHLHKLLASRTIRGLPPMPLFHVAYEDLDEREARHEAFREMLTGGVTMGELKEKPEDTLEVPKTWVNMGETPGVDGPSPHMGDGFKEGLQNLINTHNRENESDTPDYILADFLGVCLNGFDEAVRRRRAWYGADQPGVPEDPPPAFAPEAVLQRELDHAREDLAEMTTENARLREENARLREENAALGSRMHRCEMAALEAGPIPACDREEGTLEPPWEVFTRMIRERDELQARVCPGEILLTLEALRKEKETLRDRQKPEGHAEDNWTNYLAGIEAAIWRVKKKLSPARTIQEVVSPGLDPADFSDPGRPVRDPDKH